MPYYKQIERYRVQYNAGAKNTTGYKYRAIIGLYDDKGIVGAAYFHHTSDTMPDTDLQTSSGYVWCNYGADDFPNVLDLLRNEKPIYVRYVAGEWRIGSITTSLEPIGEGEEP